MADGILNALRGINPPVNGLLGNHMPVTANQNMLAQALRSRSKPPMQMQPLTPQGLLDSAALATSPVPILGDLMGLGADGYRFATDPSSRTPLNFGLSALGALPFVPPATAIFAGALAKTAKLDKKALAEGMEAAGRSRDDIWKETGWFKGPEGKWKFEIDDSGARLDGLRNAGRGDSLESSGDLQKALSHSELYGAYPDVRKIQASIEQSPRLSGEGAYSQIGPAYHEYFPQIRARDKDARSPLLHELQHFIQEKEGFQRGASFEPKATKGESEKAFNEYMRSAGEAEARAVQARMRMGQSQRQATPPWQSYDVPWDQLIIR